MQRIDGRANDFELSVLERSGVGREAQLSIYTDSHPLVPCLTFQSFPSRAIRAKQPLSAASVAQHPVKGCPKIPVGTGQRIVRLNFYSQLGSPNLLPILIRSSTL